MNATVGRDADHQGQELPQGQGHELVGFKRDGAAVVSSRPDSRRRRRMYVKLPSQAREGHVDGRPGAPSACASSPPASASPSPRTKLSPTISPRSRSRPQSTGAGPATARTDVPATAPRPTAARRRLRRRRRVNRPTPTTTTTCSPTRSRRRIGTDAAWPTPTATASPTATSTARRVDLNDDEYQQPEHGAALPGQAPVPEPARQGTRDTDYDGDGLTLTEEYSPLEVHGGRPRRDRRDRSRRRR